MNPNKKLYGINLVQHSQSTAKFEPREIKTKRKRMIIEKLLESRDKILGVKKKFERYHLNPNFIQETDASMEKFKRTPSPMKLTTRTSTLSPGKVPDGMKSENYMRIIRRNYSQHKFNPLSLTQTNQSDLPKLKQQGLINKHGRLNSQFVSRLQKILTHSSSLPRTLTLKK